jgi:hypothetical protein
MRTARTATNAEAKTIICPHCGADIGEPCHTPSGIPVAIHATRRWYAVRSPVAPVKTPVVKRPSAPRTRGAAKVEGVSYRVKTWKHTKAGGAFIAVMASVDGRPARLIGVELGPGDVTIDGWDERKLRAQVEAAVASSAAKV